MKLQLIKQINKYHLYVWESARISISCMLLYNRNRKFAIMDFLIASLNADNFSFTIIKKM